jgi:UDP-2,3-diacylglucosamine pyrophosphatase LpxH
MHFNGIDIRLNAIHETRDGRQFLVLHGDEFDSIVCHNKSLSYIGGEAYEVLLVINRWLNNIRSMLGYNHWSLSLFLKNKVKNIVSFMDNYQHVLSLEAQKRHVDGIICGHIHHADITQMEFGKTYCNCGDWVENCTALFVDERGRLALISWQEEGQALLDREAAQAPAYSRAA